MAVRTVIRADSYADSVSLMAVSQKLSLLPGVQAAVVAMGTAMNKELLQNLGLLTAELAASGPLDLVIAIRAESDAQAGAAAAAAESMLGQRAAAGAGGGAGAGVGAGGSRAAPRSIQAAVKAEPDLGLALISVPGAFAFREGRLALEQGLHVMLYSDNVPLEAEIALKQMAHEKGLLLMGPDCGTAILDGVGLGFANAVRRGPVGIVAASGTGAQELSSLIDRLGSGVSQLIGTGGRDLSSAVGGIMVMDGLKLLQDDPETKVILLISKPPAPAVAARVLAFAESGPKPVVVCFLGGEGALSIDEAAVNAVSLALKEPESTVAARLGYGPGVAWLPTGAGRRYVRGLFSGGTLCDQALGILEKALGPVTCNVHPDPARRGGASRSVGHTLVDLGDDQFTSGRPHPMIDATLRRMRLREEAADPETAIILLDIVLGHGADPDPAGALGGAIREAVQGGVVVVASVTGTEADPQRLGEQIARLKAAGAHVAPTARRAAEVVAANLAGRRP